MAKKVTKERFVELCKKFKISLGELPAFPPKTFFDSEERLIAFFKSIKQKNGTTSKNK